MEEHNITKVEETKKPIKTISKVEEIKKNNLIKTLVTLPAKLKMKTKSPTQKAKKEVKKKEKDSIIVKILKSFLFNRGRTKLSRTAMMSFIFFIMAISLFIIGVLAYLCGGKELPNSIYVYCGTLVGGGFLQYSFGKKFYNKGKQ